MDLVEFELHEGRFALPMARVIELAPAVRFQPLPGAPSVVEGMINHAGTPVPLVNLRAVFGLEPRAGGTSESWKDHLIIARGASRVFALRVDRAIGLTQVEIEEIRSGTPSRHVQGVAVLPERDFLYIQDLDALLSLTEEAELARALTQAQAQAHASAPQVHAPESSGTSSGT